VVVHHKADGFYDHTQSVRAETVERMEMPFEQAAEKIENGTDGAWYLQQASIDHQLPKLKDVLEKLPWLRRVKIYTDNLWFGGLAMPTV
jgi:hypothetical protein